MKFRMRILDTAYNSKGTTAQAEIYGILDNGKKAVAVVNNFSSYCYVEYSVQLLEQLLHNKDILSYAVTVLLHNQLPKKVIKLWVRYPWLVPQLRKEYSQYEFYASDIMYGLRFMYDMDLGNCIEIEGEPVSSDKYSASTVIKVQNIKNIEPFETKLKILSFDIENDRSGRILCLCAALLDEDGKVLDEKRFYKGSEANIVEDFVKYFWSCDPEILTGYFINGYDLPVLEKKAKDYKLFTQTHGKLPLSSNFSALQCKDKNTRSVGLIVADAHYWAKRLIKPKRQSLNFVANLLLGRQKLDVNRADMDGEWAHDKYKVIEYCLVDAKLAAEVLIATDALKRAKDMSIVARLPLSDIMADHQSFIADSLLIREADREGKLVPMNHYDNEDKKNRDKIRGAYVREIPKGIFDKVIGLDFKGMYPSMIINNNICFSTYDMINGSVVSPVGAKFVSRDIREGIIPRIMKQLRDQREFFKQKKSEAQQANNKGTMKYYDNLQDSVKITMNSFYGVLTSSFYRFTNKHIGESITAYARQNIHRVIDGLEEMGHTVIYSDTDSVFFLTDTDDLEKVIEIGKEVAQKFSQGEAELEFEKVMDPLFAIGKKKKYYGKIVWPSDTYIVRGFQNRRGDSFDFVSDTLDILFEKIGKKDSDGSVQYLKVRWDELVNQEAPIDQLIISKTVKDEGDYEYPDRMPHVQAARKLRDLGMVVPPHTKVDYIVTNGHIVPQEVEPVHPSINRDVYPDWEYYKDKFISVFRDIADVLGISELELRQNQKQMSLLEF